MPKRGSGKYASRKDQQAAAYLRNKDKIRDRAFRQQYGLTLDERNALIAAQGSICLLCGLEFDDDNPSRRPHVDHDHATGQVRGMLCLVCNTGLGKWENAKNSGLSNLYDAYVTGFRLAYLRSLPIEVRQKFAMDLLAP